jgi:GT2 family glycosyltransferase
MGDKRNPIQVVLVLYGCKPSESLALASLQRILEREVDLPHLLSLLIYDNSPCSSVNMDELPDWAEYSHDSRNGGLAAAYNCALTRAVKNNCSWLMLLDQDTLLTAEYLHEAFAHIYEFIQPDEVVAIVPRLVERKSTHSPTVKKLIRDKAIPKDFAGISKERIFAFNSGAIIRVKALEQIGGFPKDFWLDALDHAVFHLLQQKGGRVAVMRSRMEHSLSLKNLAESMSLQRYQNILAADALCTRRYFGTWDRLRRRLRLLYSAIKQLSRKKEWKFAPVSLRFALGSIMRRRTDTTKI